ncbi:MAG: hypothetical protein FJ030_16740 [Chloroflexi bacterium]|nr:hypothetical protein [Chloroflexota bacterium]
MATSGKLTARKARAIASLLKETDVSSAAKAAGIGERTLHRWLRDADFQRELKAAEGRAIDTAVRRLADLTGTAVEKLRDAMTAKDAPLSAQVRAADIVLSRLLELRQLSDFESRLAAIEDALKVATKGNKQ